MRVISSSSEVSAVQDHTGRYAILLLLAARYDQYKTRETIRIQDLQVDSERDRRTRERNEDRQSNIPPLDAGSSVLVTRSLTYLSVPLTRQPPLLHPMSHICTSITPTSSSFLFPRSALDGWSGVCSKSLRWESVHCTFVKPSALIRFVGAKARCLA